MTLKLYYHPLASFCHKALIALYEGEIAFEPIVIDLGNEASSAAFKAIWPLAKMPVLRDETRDCTVAESTMVVEYLDAHYGTRLIPANADLAWQTRMWDRVYDHYVQEPMQKIVGDRLRPTGTGDPFGVEQAHTRLREIYGIIEQQMEGGGWTVDDTFTLADCAAAPALFYANTVAPFDATQRNLIAYLDRLMARPSFARVLQEAQPYFDLFPLERKPKLAKPRLSAAT
jgi:glutathione S-transferase